MLSVKSQAAHVKKKNPRLQNGEILFKIREIPPAVLGADGSPVWFMTCWDPLVFVWNTWWSSTIISGVHPEQPKHIDSIIEIIESIHGISQRVGLLNQTLDFHQWGLRDHDKPGRGRDSPGTVHQRSPQRQPLKRCWKPCAWAPIPSGLH